MRTQDLCRPIRIRHLQAMCAVETKKLHYQLNQEMSRVHKFIYGKKNEVPNCNTIVYRRSKE